MNTLSMRPQSLVTPFRHLLHRTALSLLLALSMTAGAQQPSAPPATPSTTSSFADFLKSHNAHRLHILYVHGIGDDGPTDRDSYYLRRGMCETLRCDHAHRDGTEIQAPVFANTGQFLAHSTPPSLTFLGQPVFPVDASGHSEMWDASAPFFRRYKLTPAEGQPVYVDEVNWWPLVFAVKCRYMIAADATLVGIDKTKQSRASALNDCNQPKVQDPATGHFSSYPFITPAEAAQLLTLPHRGARINRAVKNSLMNWNITDAILSLGPMRPILLDGLQQVIRLAVPLPADPTLDASQPQEFVIVTHSLGSYLVFAALDTAPKSGSPFTQSDFTYVLAHTSRVYFFANQLRLLEMADLDRSRGANLTEHLAAWVNARNVFLTSSTGTANEAPPQLVAWNDPSDLLTWEVPSICGVVVENQIVQNSFNWFGLIEDPTKAHDYYGLNKKVIQEMLHSDMHPPPPQPCPAAAPATAATVQ